MKATITNNSQIVKALEAKLNKDILRVCEGVDEDRIYFADDTSAYCIVEIIFDADIKVCVTLLNEDFDFVDKMELIINS